jgi:DNA integrity scanning protein DisA with diadenylate cyclase activity
MAATIAYATGGDSTREKVAHRLGSRYASGSAQTWHSKATATIRADGSGTLALYRNGSLVVEVSFDPESSECAHIATVYRAPGAIVKTL